MGITMTVAGYTMTGLTPAKKLLAKSLSYQKTLGQIDAVDAAIVSEDGSFIPQVGHPVTLSDSVLGAFFGGFIETAKSIILEGSEGVTTRISALGWEAKCKQRYTGYRFYDNLTAGAIIRDLITNCMTGDGFDADNVVDGPTIEFIEFDFVNVAQAIDAIRDMCPGYYWFVDHDKSFHFKLWNADAAPFNFIDGDGNALLGISRQVSSGDGYANRVYLRMDHLIQESCSDTLHGDNSTRIFTTTKPVSAIKSISAKGVYKTEIGINGIDSGKQYYWDPGSTRIVQGDGEDILGPGDDLIIEYTSEIEAVLPAVQDNDEIDARSAVEGGTGYHEIVIRSNTTGRSGDGSSIQQAYLNTYGELPESVEVMTIKAGLRVGHNITIQRAKLGINGSFMIDQVGMEDLGGLFRWTVRCVSGASLGDWKSKLGNLVTGSSGGTASGTGGADATAKNVPLQPTLVTCSEHKADRYLDDVNLTRGYIYPVATMPANHGALWLHWWISEDDGVTWGYIGRTWIGDTPSFDVLIPHNNTNWKIKCSSGNDTLEHGVDEAVISASFQIDGLSPIPASGTTALKNGSVTYEVRTSDRTRFWPSAQWTNPTDVNFFHPRLKMRRTNEAGTPCPYGEEGQWREVSQGDGSNTVPGTVITWKEIGGWGLPFSDEGTSGYRYYEFALFGVTRAGQETQAQCWNGNTTTTYRLYVAESQVYDPGALDGAGIGAGLTKTAAGIKLGTDNLANLIMNPGFEDDLAQWDVLGTVAIAGGAMTGTKCLSMNVPTGVEQRVSCRPGDAFYTESWVKKANSPSHGVYLVIRFLDASKVGLEGWKWYAYGAPVASDEWQKISAAATAPAGASYIDIVVVVDGGLVSGGWLCDNVLLRRVSTASEIALGAGLASYQDKVVLDTGGDIDIDAITQKPIVKPSVIDSTNLVDGSLGADPDKIAAGRNMIGIYAGLPSAVDETIPPFIFNTLDGIVYRRFGGAWVKSTKPEDLLAGTIGSSVVHAGTVYAEKIVETGGGISGCRLSLFINGVTTFITNVYDNVYGAYGGVVVWKHASEGPPITYDQDRAIISYAGLAVVGHTGMRSAEVSAGYIAIRDASGNIIFDVNASTTGVNINGVGGVAAITISGAAGSITATGQISAETVYGTALITSDGPVVATTYVSGADVYVTGTFHAYRGGTDCPGIDASVIYTKMGGGFGELAFVGGLLVRVSTL